MLDVSQIWICYLKIKVLAGLYTFSFACPAILNKILYNELENNLFEWSRYASGYCGWEKDRGSTRVNYSPLSVNTEFTVNFFRQSTLVASFLAFCFLFVFFQTTLLPNPIKRVRLYKSQDMHQFKAWLWAGYQWDLSLSSLRQGDGRFVFLTS